MNIRLAVCKRFWVFDGYEEAVPCKTSMSVLPSGLILVRNEAVKGPFGLWLIPVGGRSHESGVTGRVSTIAQLQRTLCQWRQQDRTQLWGEVDGPRIAQVTSCTIRGFASRSEATLFRRGGVNDYSRKQK